MVVYSAEDVVSFLFKIIISVIFVQVVPGAEVFRMKPMILLIMVYSVFNCTPPWLVSEKHSSGHQNMSSGRMSSEKRRTSSKEVEEEKINTYMCKVYKINELKTSKIHIHFCLSIFKDPVIRKYFDYLSNELLRYEYVIKNYDEHVTP